MTLGEFELVQREDRREALFSLLENCIMKYLLAASLVGVGGPIIERIRNAKCKGKVDLAPLLPAWELISERYRRERFDPQPGLFKEHGADVLERWAKFLHWELFPSLLSENEFVRNVLRASGLLPCHSKDGSITAICHHLTEMSLPFVPPPWDSAEME
jgi:hypothetical protein